MPPTSEAIEVAMLAGVVLFLVIAGIALPVVAGSRAAGWLSDRRIAALVKQVNQHSRQEDWAAAVPHLRKIVRLLRKRQPTGDVLADLARALDDLASFVFELGDEDEALRLHREAYRLAATVDGLPRHELARLAFNLGAALCGQRQVSEATFYLDMAFVGADPDSDLAAMARIQASSALRRNGQMAQALECARDAVRLAEAIPDGRAMVARAQLVLAMALADGGQDGREAAKQALDGLDEADSEVLLAGACYVNGYVAADPADRVRHALRAREIFQRLDQRSPGRHRHDLADVEQLLGRDRPSAKVNAVSG